MVSIMTSLRNVGILQQQTSMLSMMVFKKEKFSSKASMGLLFITFATQSSLPLWNRRLQTYFSSKPLHDADYQAPSKQATTSDHETKTQKSIWLHQVKDHSRLSGLVL